MGDEATISYTGLGKYLSQATPQRSRLRLSLSEDGQSFIIKEGIQQGILKECLIEKAD